MIEWSNHLCIWKGNQWNYKKEFKDTKHDPFDSKTN